MEWLPVACRDHDVRSGCRVLSVQVAPAPVWARECARHAGGQRVGRRAGARVPLAVSRMPRCEVRVLVRRPVVVGGEMGRGTVHVRLMARGRAGGHLGGIRMARLRRPIRRAEGAAVTFPGVRQPMAGALCLRRGLLKKTPPVIVSTVSMRLRPLNGLARPWRAPPAPPHCRRRSLRAIRMRPRPRPPFSAGGSPRG